MSDYRKNIADYFPHFCGKDQTVEILESMFQKDGYVFWYKLQEILGRSEYHFFDARKTMRLLHLVASTIGDQEKTMEILELLAKLEEIDSELWQHKIIWSKKFVIGLGPLYSRRTGECMQKEEICRHLKIDCGQQGNKTPPLVSKVGQRKGEESKGNKSKENLTSLGEIISDKYEDGRNCNNDNEDLKIFNEEEIRQAQKIADELNDQHSLRSLCWIVRKIPANAIDRALVTTREKRSEIADRKAYFQKCMLEYAKEKNIDIYPKKKKG